MAVSELNSYIKRQLQFDPILSQLRVVGEISNFKLHSSGHIYFTLKDETSKIQCVMFRSDAENLDYMPADGEKTEISGRVSVYEREGKYQIYVTSMTEVGKGELFKAFNLLKDRLDKEGYFLKSNEIPRFPAKVGLITSPTSAAVRDMITVMTRRNPYVEIQIYPVHVQGEMAKFEIASAIDYFNDNPVDTIIVSRGGGSIEELWAFNELMVAEAIYASKIPVISGVGHETDFTISDFVSDKRAATPSEAAEMAVSDMSVYYDHLSLQKSRLIQSVSNEIQSKKILLERSNKKKLCQLISRDISTEKSQLEWSGTRLRNAMEFLTMSYGNHLEKLALRLDGASPLSTLNRGYAVVQKDHKTITSVDDVQVTDSIDIILKNGIIKTEVISKERKTHNE
ncbi:exodeoxyribonuclease VII large subunit [Acidaminobacter sp. JC074]|uniref:exodeoxyribonuclease VII large subunit n=1 Tax=Acidaminobacter sp. JC074 TaxID=2530199 RepID=UPI001F0FE888|nr:exodeoxyribonuclease VII large subunit [Acidaminobacter sp. JC074]MCH4888822.1 exodeoxyribonuclease VII large subunit [Acidaminobacter sp. JC074]